MERNNVIRVLLTGGAGYVGSHTLLELLLAGHDVMVVDNLSNGHREALNRVKQLAKRNFCFVECDICDQPALVGGLEQFRPDAVVHFAGLKAVGESVQEPLRYYENNVYGSISLLKAMDITECKNIVFSSSATVYGNPDAPPCREDHPTQPINPYGQTKLMVEQLLTDWAAAQAGRNAVAMRYFNPIGAHPSGRIGEHPAGVPNNLMPHISQVALGKKPRLYSESWRSRICRLDVEL